MPNFTPKHQYVEIPGFITPNTILTLLLGINIFFEIDKPEKNND